MRTGGVIIAGGRSSRMGREKTFAMLGGQTMLSRIIARIAPQVEALAINANGDTARFPYAGLPVVPDDIAIATPLAGLHAALRWGAREGLDSVITVPSDSPFLPHDLATRLQGPGAAVAASGSHTHHLTGFWPISLIEQLEQALSSAGIAKSADVMGHGGVLRAQDWVRLARAVTVSWPNQPYDPFFNVNTPEDLAKAERIAAEFDP